MKTPHVVVRDDGKLTKEYKSRLYHEDEDGAEVTEEPQRKLTKQEQAELLRQMVDTVGQVGKPGEQIQKVISVGMLSEGWDAKTVTHIMGLRAFSSQLLCEQVVGRGLRHTSYEVSPETGLFEAEYVNIFGVPSRIVEPFFSLSRFAGEGRGEGLLQPYYNPLHSPAKTVRVKPWR